MNVVREAEGAVATIARRRPRWITVSAVLMLLAAGASLYSAAMALLLSNTLLSYSWETYRMMGDIIRVLGVVEAIIGLLFLIVGIGLLRMEDWVVLLGIRVCEFGLLVGFLALSPIVAIASAFVFIYLRLPSTRAEFDRYGYSTPSMSGLSARAVVGATPATRRPERKRLRSSGRSKPLPEGFVKCPQCATLNAHTRKRCRMCATIISGTPD